MHLFQNAFISINPYLLWQTKELGYTLTISGSSSLFKNTFKYSLVGLHLY